MKLIIKTLVFLSLLQASYLAACTESTIPKTVVQAQIDAYNAHDVDLFVSCFSEDVEVIQLDGSRPTIKGRKMLKKEYSFLKRKPKEFKVEVISTSVVGPVVVLHERLHGRANGQFPLDLLAAYEVRKGKITKLWFPPIH